MPLPNTFGLCEDIRTVRFLESVNATTCSRYTTYTNCDTALAAQTYQQPAFASTGTTPATITAGLIWVVNAATGAVSTATSSFQTTSKTTAGALCTCNNVLKEIHYTVYTEGGNRITNILVDVVYMNLAAATCTNTLRFEQTYSVTFKDNIYARAQSGSPGYQKGLPLLAGARNTASTNFISANERGFELYGADDDGNCIINTNAINPKELYYSNPRLTFVDGAMYGCKLSYTLAQLQSFCTGTNYQHIALFKHLINNLKFVGSYGNANPHYIKDWVAVEYETSSATAATFSGRACTFDAGYSLKFYLTKLGTKSNPQYKISRVRLSPHRLTWTHSLPSATSAQDFHVQLSVSFHEVPQSTSEFIPKPPNKLPKMGRNVLYPFFIYDKASDFAAVMVVPVLIQLYYLLIA